MTAAGLVRGVAPGTAVITVRTNDGGFEATCAVTVLNASDSGTTLEDMADEEDLFESEFLE